MNKLIVFIAALLLIPISSLVAQEAEVPVLSGRVNDYVGLLSDEQTERLEQKLKAFEDSTTTQVVVLLIRTLNGSELESFATQVFNTWGLGQAGADNGVLLLVVADERKMRIEVGYGLEGDLTDAVAGRIIRNVIAPRFKKREFAAGISEGTNAIMQAASGAEISGIDGKPWPGEMVAWLWFVLGIVLIPIGFFVRKKILRYRPRVSKATGEKMQRLSEKADDAHLDAGQLVEERLGSVDYDVWTTTDGSDREIVAYKRWTSYNPCPKCAYRTFKDGDVDVIERATYSHSGRKKITAGCENCGHTASRIVRIPRKVRSSSGGYSSSGGGGFSSGGGGGFSGGGGSSGGGGASGGW